MEILPSGIRFRHWRVGEAKACVLLIHGLAEHTGRYEKLAARLIAGRIAMVGPDHVGHGGSPGSRAHLTRFDEYLAPLKALRIKIGEWYPNKPVFVLGHSMGGLIAVHLLLDDSSFYQGALFSAPAFAVANPVPLPLIWLGRFLRHVAPKMGMLALDPYQVSRDPAVVNDYIDDPLVYGGKISAALSIEMLNAMEVAIARAGEIELPVYIGHGDADAMAEPKGSEVFHRALGSHDKTLEIWPGLYHEIFNEPESEKVITQYLNWLEEHL